MRMWRKNIYTLWRHQKDTFAALLAHLFTAKHWNQPKLIRFHRQKFRYKWRKIVIYSELKMVCDDLSLNLRVPGICRIPDSWSKAAHRTLLKPWHEQTFRFVRVVNYERRCDTLSDLNSFRGGGGGALLFNHFPSLALVKSGRSRTPFYWYGLTDWGLDKMGTISRRHFQMYFLERKCMNFA